MGFSVSGSFAILAFATFVAIGTLYPTIAMGVDQISRAQAEVNSDQLVRQNTDITITVADWSGLIQNTLTVEVENTGSTVLSIDEIDVIVDNDYYERDEFSEEYIVQSDGSNTSETDLWQPGEIYHVEITESVLDPSPDRVKIVSGPGVSDSAEVE